MKAEREAQLIAEKSDGDDSDSVIKGAGLRAWAKDAGVGLKMNWVLLCYMVVLMTGRTSSRNPRTIALMICRIQQLQPWFTRLLSHIPQKPYVNYGAGVESCGRC